MDGRELLKTSHAPDSEHRPLPSSERKVRVPRTVVQQAACSLPALYTIPHRRAAGPQLIRHGDLGSAMLFRCFRKNSWRDLLVSRLRHKALPHVALVIDAPPPKVVPLAADLHDDFVQVPTPAAVYHAFDTTFRDLRGEDRAKPVPRKPNRLVADFDTASYSRSRTFRSDSGNRT